MLRPLLNLIRNHNGPVNIAVDCSDSIGNNGIKIAYATAIQALLSSITDRSGVVIFFTTRIEHIVPINQLLEFGVYNLLKTIPPGGGTLAPVYDFLSVASKDDLLVVLTDGYVKLPPEPHFPVAWALLGSPHYTEPCYYSKEGLIFYGPHFHIGGEHNGTIVGDAVAKV